MRKKIVIISRIVVVIFVALITTVIILTRNKESDFSQSTGGAYEPNNIYPVQSIIQMKIYLLAHLDFPIRIRLFLSTAEVGGEARKHRRSSMIWAIQGSLSAAE